jgi:PAS domain S-box-containing protein
MLCVAGFDGYFKEINPAWSKYLGWSEEELLAKPYIEFVHPDDRQATIEAGQCLAEGKPVFGFENRYRTKEGAYHRITWNAFPLTQEQLIFSVARDSIDRERIEAALRESEEKFQNVVESSPMGVHMYRLEAGGRLVFTGANEAADVILGVDNSQFIGKTIEEAFPPLAETEVPDQYRHVAAEGTRWQTEQIDYHDEKIRGAYEVYAFRTAPGMMAALFLDITERKRAEEALRESEERFRSLVQHLSDIVWVVDENIICSYETPSCSRILGYDPGFFIGKSGLEYIHPGDIDLVREGFSEVLYMENDFVPIKFHMRHADGHWVEIEAIANNLLDHPGINGVVITARDITERTRLEEQLQQAQKMEAIGTLTAGIAHDFNNLLTTIIGGADLVMSKLDDNDPISEPIGDILAAGNSAKNLTRQLLAFSRKQVFEAKLVDINEVIMDMEKMLHRVIREDIKLLTYFESTEGKVKADPLQLEHVLINLAVNAVDAMPDGGKLIIETSDVVLENEYIRAHAVAVPGRYVLLSVSDTGHGMEKAMLDKIFDPFFTTKEREKGTGLGLAMVYGIVKQHGGYIWVYSEPERGSTFKIYLPVADQQETEKAAEPDTAKALTGSETILVVEDEKIVRDLVCRTLEASGYAILKAKDVYDALRIAKGHADEIDLLITDIVMPGMNGKELNERMTKVIPDLKVLYMSGYSDNVISHDGFIDDGVKFLQKPFTIGDLTARVRDALKG